jgi:hypothetical protein
MTMTVQVFRHVRHVTRRTGELAFAVELIARRTSTSMYQSRTCATREEAQALCDRYLARNPQFEDTTTLSEALKTER